MKVLLITVLAVGLSASAFSFAGAVGAAEITSSSLRQTSDGPIRTLQGDVRIETRDLIVRADKATFNANTLDIEPAGHVHITLKK